MSQEDIETTEIDIKTNECVKSVVIAELEPKLMVREDEKIAKEQNVENYEAKIA